MAVTLTAVPKEEGRSVIWFLALQNVSGSENHTRMCAVHGVQNIVIFIVTV